MDYQERLVGRVFQVIREFQDLVVKLEFQVSVELRVLLGFQVSVELRVLLGFQVSLELWVRLE